jgi:uncharacterized protein involved in exopolysaccharide biosynthesis
MTDKNSETTNNEIQTDNNQQQDRTFSDAVTDFILKIKPHFRILWQNKWKLLAINIIIFLLTVAYLLFLTKPYYQSTVIILPEYGNKGSELIGQFSGLASFAGVNVGDTPPAMIYRNLLTSETVLSDAIYTKYQTKVFDKPVDLIEYFEIKPDKSLPTDLRKREMFLRLYDNLTNGKIAIDLDRMTKILTVTVEMPESKLSAEVVNTLVKSLDLYIRTKRKSYATEQRKYLESRIDQLKDTLTISEEKLKDFRSQNRMIMQSPELQLEQTRLIRNVEIQQTVYGELLKQLELVKLAQVKDTPVINIKELAGEPILKTGPKRMNTLIIITFISILFSSAYFIFRGGFKIIIDRLKFKGIDNT